MARYSIIVVNRYGSALRYYHMIAGNRLATTTAGGDVSRSIRHTWRILSLLRAEKHRGYVGIMWGVCGDYVGIIGGLDDHDVQRRAIGRQAARIDSELNLNPACLGQNRLE